MTPRHTPEVQWPTKAELDILHILWERGPSTVRDDGVTDVGAVNRLGVCVQDLLLQFVGRRISDSAGVDEDALVGQVCQETAALGETVGRMQGDRLPNPVDVVFPDAVLP